MIDIKENAFDSYKLTTYHNTPKFSLEGKEGWARLVNVYDGDTLTVILKLDERMCKMQVRLKGIDAYEMNGKNKTKAIAAKLYLIKCLTGIHLEQNVSRIELIRMLDDEVYLIYLKCNGFDKYGRLLAEVSTCKEDFSNYNVSNVLVQRGFAREYFGGQKDKDLS